MADSPTHAGVIPLFRGRTDPPAQRRTFSLRRLLPQSMPALAAAAADLFTPAVLLAAGVGLLAAAGCSIARSAGLTTSSTAAVAATAGLWAFLAAGGAALTARGLALARAQWARPEAE